MRRSRHPSSAEVVRTSQTDPIRVNWLIRDDEPHPWLAHGDPGEGRRGRLGLTLLPGKRCPGIAGTWRRDLGLDLERLQGMGVQVIVCLVQEHELRSCDVVDYPAAAQAHHMAWVSFPIPDGGVPGDLDGTIELARRLAGWLQEGRRVVVHCRGGLGRAGLVGACALLAVGRLHSAAEAIALVRSRRPGTVENRTQERFIERVAERMHLPGRAHITLLDRLARRRPLADPERDMRSCGAMIGLAVGDALGAPVEFQSANAIAARHGVVDEMMAGGPWLAGEWTDDTALTLATAAAYLANGFAPEEACHQMIAWLQSRPKDVGNLTAMAIGEMSRGDPVQAGHRALAGRRGSAGNGSLMRALPTALVRLPGEQLVQEAIILSALTHADARCTAACVAFVTAASALIHLDARPLEAIAAGAEASRKTHPEVAAICDAVVRGEPSRYHDRPIGYVLVALERALSSLRDAVDYESGVRDVV